MIKHYIEKVAAGDNLTIEESFDAMDKIMSGGINNSQLSGFLIALKTKTETAEEIAGFTKAMRNKSIKLNIDTTNLVDVCGTGGDYSGTFNISTATAFVVAGAGVRVAKHGNRSISSKTGSADVLAELGININLTAKQAEAALETAGITFLFAPNYHPAMKYATEVRRELGMKTVFNMLGPLINPAGVKRQLIGVFSRKVANILANATVYLDMEKVCFVNTSDCLDEISLTGITECNEYSHGQDIKVYNITNKTFDYPEVELKNILGDTSACNAAIILGILKDKKINSAFYVIAANAAFALYCAGFSNDMKVCLKAAEEAILSGAAFNKLNILKKIGEMAA
ncbi:MAG: anthranilate phosphoribosyltransferase [Ignavibacteria bacterium]